MPDPTPTTDPATSKLELPAAEPPNPFAALLKPDGDKPPAPDEPPGTDGDKPPPTATGDQDAKERTWQDILRRDKEVTERAARLSSDTRELEQLRQVAQLARTDPLRAMQVLHVNEGDLLDQMIARRQQDASPTTAPPQLSALEQRVAESERKAEIREAQSDLHDQIRLELLSGGHEAEMLLKMMRSPGNTVMKDVAAELAETWHKSGSLDIPGAIKAAEDKYTRQAFGLAEVLTGSTKVREQLMKLLGVSGNDKQPGHSNPPSPGADTTPQRSTSPTLSNDLQRQAATTTRKTMTLEQKQEAFNDAIRASWRAKRKQEG